MNILSIEFVRNAYMIGTIIAIVSAIVGYFVVLRGLSFAAHSLADIGFAGATGAILLNVNPIYGLLAFTIVAGSVMGYLGEKVRGRDVAIGIVLSFTLGLGALFLTLYTKYATQAFSILFGTILGVSVSDVIQTAILGLLCILVIAYIYRPLLFSSIDPLVAFSKGVPVQFLSILFFIILAVTVSIAVQIIGVLLIFTLILVPAATAQYLTAKPLHTILVAIGIGVFVTWVGITLSYYIAWPVGFFISSLAFLLYICARLYSVVS
jgi:zinc/manganese transport system permease protein